MSSDYYTEKLICTLEKYEDIEGAYQNNRGVNDCIRICYNFIIFFK